MFIPQEFEQLYSSGTSALDTAFRSSSVMPELAEALSMNLNQASAAPAVIPDPGNTLATAYNIGTLSGTPTLTDFVGTSDRHDYYRFSLSSTSDFNLSLTGISSGADADVELLDSNGNFITSSASWYSADESINRAGLGAGTYYIHVYQYSGDTNYALRLSTTNPSNLLPTEVSIGNLSGTRTFSGEWVGNSDTADVYRFSLGSTSYVNLLLDGMSSDADLRLIRDANGNGIVDTGDEITRSARGSSYPEWISRSLAAGTYFAQVYPWNGNSTAYNLTLFTVADAGIGNLLQSAASDYQVTRNEMIGILRNAEDGSIIDTTELSDLRTIVSETRPFMEDYVYNLSNKIVNPYDPNIRSGIGNLVGNDPATRMENLIGKHFLGTDHSAAASGTTYQYVSGSLFQNGISYSDIAQSPILGDCYYLAALAGTAFRTPNTIQSMFTDNGDNTYTVRFYNNGVADYVTVDRYLPTYSDGTAVYASWNGGSRFESNNELWVALAEKAYAQINEAGWIGHGTSNSYSAIEGGWPDDAVEQITARDTVRDWTLTDSDRTAVINAFNAGRTVFLNWWDHALTLVGYNSTTQLFTIHNPHGYERQLTWQQILNGGNGWPRFTDWSHTTT